LFPLNKIMKTLGIDYGQKKAGVAIGVDKFAEPLKVIRFNDVNILVSEIRKIVADENIEKVIVGVSENSMAKESGDFAKSIGAEVFDETLTTRDAQTMSIESGISRKKRREMEDAYAATVMLQNYLDS
jgi:putative Holliday junction resolvase